MLNIKNLNLITDKMSDFSLLDLKYILDFKYYINMNSVALFDEYNESALEITFISPRNYSNTYKIVMRFKKVSNLSFGAGGTVTKISGFEIVNIKDRNWDSLNYLVKDYEDDEFKFYCKEIEVVSVEKVDLVVQ